MGTGLTEMGLYENRMGWNDTCIGTGIVGVRQQGWLAAETSKRHSWSWKIPVPWNTEFPRALSRTTRSVQTISQRSASNWTSAAEASTITSISRSSPSAITEFGRKGFKHKNRKDRSWVIRYTTREVVRGRFVFIVDHFGAWSFLLHALLSEFQKVSIWRRAAMAYEASLFMHEMDEKLSEK